MSSNMFYLLEFEISVSEQFQKSGHFGKSIFSSESYYLQGQKTKKQNPNLNISGIFLRTEKYVELQYVWFLGQNIFGFCLSVSFIHTAPCQFLCLTPWELFYLRAKLCPSQVTTDRPCFDFSFFFFFFWQFWTSSFLPSCRTEDLQNHGVCRFLIFCFSI